MLTSSAGRSGDCKRTRRRSLPAGVVGRRTLSRVVLAALLDRMVAARRAGIDFDEAWADAREAALHAAADKRGQREWSSALDATAASWRAAYERQPPPRAALEQVLQTLP